jgi:hypothetical protein
VDHGTRTRPPTSKWEVIGSAIQSTSCTLRLVLVLLALSVPVIMLGILR